MRKLSDLPCLAHLAGLPKIFRLHSVIQNAQRPLVAVFHPRKSRVNLPLKTHPSSSCSVVHASLSQYRRRDELAIQTRLFSYADAAWIEAARGRVADGMRVGEGVRPGSGFVGTVGTCSGLDRNPHQKRGSAPMILFSPGKGEARAARRMEESPRPRVHTGECVKRTHGV